MKKLFIYLSAIFFLSVFCPNALCAVSTQSAEISKIENDIYGFDYNNDEFINRIERLEKTIYGKAAQGDINKRLKKLISDITADQIGLEIPPVEDTFSEENEIADSTVDYPVVNEIEMKLFNQTYKNRDFHTRIVTIERKLFNKIYDVDDYQTRMDRIKAEVMPEALATDSNRFDYNNAISSEELSGLNGSRYSGRMPFGQKNYTRPYVNYGDNYDSYNYSQNNFSPNFGDELSQMEYDTFGTEFSNESTKSRIKRLNSANKARKSARKYDSQKFQQHLSTAMEIGAMILMILAMVL